MPIPAALRHLTKDLQRLLAPLTLAAFRRTDYASGSYVEINPGPTTGDGGHVIVQNATGYTIIQKYLGYGFLKNIDSLAGGFYISTGAVDTLRWQVSGTGNLEPLFDNAYSIGNASFRATAIYAVNGTIQTSDLRHKTSVEPIAHDKAAAMVDAVDPITYKWNVGKNIIVGAEGPESDLPGRPIGQPEPGKRTHAGFGAQHVRAAMLDQGMDFAAWGLDDADDPESRQWVRPDELVPILWAALKQTRAELAEIKQKVG